MSKAMRLRGIVPVAGSMLAALLAAPAYSGNVVSSDNQLWAKDEVRILLCDAKSRDRNCGDTKAERRQNALSIDELSVVRQAMDAWRAEFGRHLVFEESKGLPGSGVVVQAPRRPSRCSTRWTGFRRKQPISRILVGSNCNAKNFARTSVGSILHELMHVAGVYHEQQRSDRGRYIGVHGRASNVRQWNRICVTGACAREDREAKPSGHYDFASIMHYGLSDDAGDRRVTLTALGQQRLRQQGMTLRGIGQRAGLSMGDIATIKRLYPRAE